MRLEATARLTDARIVLQAGGDGRRLKSVDDSRAKPMLTVGGKPIIERLLAQLVAAGSREFIVVTGSTGDAIEEHITALARTAFRGADISFYREPQPLGNAGALARLRRGTGTTVFLFADLVTDIDFAALLRTHHERACDITLASHYEEHRLSLGELVTEGDAVMDYLEKPTKRFLICSGIAAIQPSALDIAAQMIPPFGISDFVNTARRETCRVTHWLHGARWLDVNTPEILQRARAAFVEQA